MNSESSGLARRRFLRTAGVAVALPMLESFRGASRAAQGGESASPAKRLVCIGSNLGFYRPAFYPAQSGRDYEASQLLSVIDHHRQDYSIFSGLDHAAGNGHKNWDNFLCGRKVGSYSLDQQVADHIGKETRFPSIQLCAGDIPKQRMCFSRLGTPLPMNNRPSAIYNRLFVTGAARERTEYLLKSGRSALDAVVDEAKSLQGRVASADAERLDQYFSAIRELENDMGRQLRHLGDGAVEVNYELPAYDPMAPTMMLECEKIMLDLIALALQTDATRVSTLFIAGLGQVFTLDGQTLRAGYHALSHHGNDPDLIRDLVRVEQEHMRCLDRFLTQLKSQTDSEGKPLLDSTVVLVGTGMGDASRHSNRDLPTLVAGGGFRHGQHHAFDNDDAGYRLGDVYLSILRRFGIDAEQFSGAKRGFSDWA